MSDHGAPYMQQWQLDELRKAEGQYINGEVMPAKKIMSLDLSMNPPKQTAFQRFLSWFK